MIIIGTFFADLAAVVLAGADLGSQSPHLRVNRDLPDLFGSPPTSARPVGAIVVGGSSRLGGFGRFSFFPAYMPKDFSRHEPSAVSIMQVFLLIMVALPLKMMLRLLWHIKSSMDHAVVSTSS